MEGQREPNTAHQCFGEQNAALTLRYGRQRWPRNQSINVNLKQFLIVLLLLFLTLLNQPAVAILAPKIWGFCAPPRTLQDRMAFTSTSIGLSPIKLHIGQCVMNTKLRVLSLSMVVLYISSSRSRLESPLTTRSFFAAQSECPGRPFLNSALVHELRSSAWDSR